MFGAVLTGRWTQKKKKKRKRKKLTGVLVTQELKEGKAEESFFLSPIMFVSALRNNEARISLWIFINNLDDFIGEKTKVGRVHHFSFKVAKLWSLQ